MDAKIDYLSFTLPLNFRGAGQSRKRHISPDEAEHPADQPGASMDETLILQTIASRLESYNLYELLDILSSGKYRDMGGRGHYGRGIHWDANNISIWWGGIANHVLIEVSGVGCQLLRDASAMIGTVNATSERVTRLDVAVDFPAGVQPAEFVDAKAENRFRVTETHDKETGRTWYVGSRQSDRFARAYMYNAPHPRAGILRVEHVLRADYAKQLAPAIVSSSLAAQVAVLGNTFGWRHPCWRPEIVTDGKLKARRHDKDDAATLRWLIKAVAPALRKAHERGLIDVLDFIQDHVITPLNEQNEQSGNSA